MTNEQIIDKLECRFKYLVETSRLLSVCALYDEITLEKYFKNYETFDTLLGKNKKVLDNIMAKSILYMVCMIIEHHDSDIVDEYDTDLMYGLTESIIHSWIDTSDQCISIVNTDIVNSISKYNTKLGIASDKNFSFKFQDYTEGKLVSYIKVLSNMGSQFVNLNDKINTPAGAITKTNGIYCNFKQFSTLLKESFDDANINLVTLPENMMIFEKDFIDDQSYLTESLIHKFIEAFEKPFITQAIHYLGFSEEVNTFGLNRIKVSVTYNKANDRFKNLILSYNIVSPNSVHSELLPECSFKFKPIDVLNVLYTDNKRFNQKNENLSADLVKFIMQFNKLILAIYRNGNDETV